MYGLLGLSFGIVVEETDPGKESFFLMLKKEILAKDVGLSPKPTPVMAVESWQRLGYLN